MILLLCFGGKLLYLIILTYLYLSLIFVFVFWYGNVVCFEVKCKKRLHGLNFNSIINVLLFIYIN